eukprot:TRINITY_DN8624_c0_g1_i1.p1 TRINITY_DN8624_c0_g1~~TRINITY_DN8624_c0_g1_i1.p1  ORF type:complete len:200 (-),score=34.05 TRINITY_DN8624_c0_g1_i1:69-668(-)
MDPFSCQDKMFNLDSNDFYKSPSNFKDNIEDNIYFQDNIVNIGDNFQDSFTSVLNEEYNNMSNGGIEENMDILANKISTNTRSNSSSTSGQFSSFISFEDIVSNSKSNQLVYLNGCTLFLKKRDKEFIGFDDPKDDSSYFSHIPENIDTVINSESSIGNNSSNQDLGNSIFNENQKILNSQQKIFENIFNSLMETLSKI